MATAPAYAEAKIAENPNDQTPQELADLFCRNARVRIDRNFKAVGKNHNSVYDKVTETLMKGEFSWMYAEDVYLDVPPEFRTETAAETAETTAEAPAEEPVPAK